MRSTNTQQRIGEQVLGVALLVGHLHVTEDPADVRVQQALERAPEAVVLAAWGLCGSPASSENWWCLRWVATQSITGPSAAAEPSAAKPARTQRLHLKLRWVSSRWKPTVMPMPIAGVTDGEDHQVLPDQQVAGPAEVQPDQDQDRRARR